MVNPAKQLVFELYHHVLNYIFPKAVLQESVYTMSSPIQNEFSSPQVVFCHFTVYMSGLAGSEIQEIMSELDLCTASQVKLGIKPATKAMIYGLSSSRSLPHITCCPFNRPLIQFFKTFFGFLSITGPK